MSMRGREGATAMQSSGCRNGIGRKRRSRRVAPVAQAITLLLTTVGAAHAQQAFSNAWFAARGAAQATASQTGRLPNGMPVTSLMDPSAQQQQANAQLQRSIANLSSAAQNIAAMQAAQANARAAAASSDTTIPDGLTEGGLKVDTNSLTKGWINAQAPTQTSANGKTHVNIQQTANKAILNWETFNVGRNTSVNFAQQSDWAVLNRVNDPQARPSQIQGQIHGDGTVLVLNRNGVIFGGTSQVDTRNLVVAAARMSDAQFQTNGIYGANGTTPTFTDALGKVEVQAGANITTRTPTSVTQGGGYVLLLGNQVSNAGTIVA
ncbi:filamentous hemagglutinin N-terminal domain-containing protein, partial [Pandoraea sp. SD6-2]|uniref:two-partner secretion domain-containing protein n=1 Tax=Pandoraea sp. SD6-2 TaxID=1286093 RepID=UPI001FED74A1